MEDENEQKDSTDSAYINAACMRDPQTARSADILRLLAIYGAMGADRCSLQSSILGESDFNCIIYTCR